MEPLSEVRIRLLSDMSADIHSQMAEIWALREAVRMAETTLRDAEPVNPAILAASQANELRA